MNVLPVDHFPSGGLVKFPSGASTSGVRVSRGVSWTLFLRNQPEPLVGDAMALTDQERCKALTKSTGERCKNRAIQDGLCAIHFGLSKSGSSFWSKAGTVATRVGAGAAAAAPIIEILKILVGAMATVVEEARYKALQGLETRILEADSAESVEEVAVALRTWFESLPETVQTQANRAIELRMGEHEELSGSPEQEAV